MSSSCPRCGKAAALHEGKPHVTTAGAVELWHARCWNDRALLFVPTRAATGEPVLLARPASSRLPRTAWLVGAGAVVAIFAIARAAHGGGGPTPTLADVDLPMHEQAPAADRAFARDEAPPPPPDQTKRFPVPMVNGQPLDDLFPTLTDWVHPVTDAAELMPGQASRGFGAERIGIERPECGAGHCGVDLDGPRGQPLVSVADGVVVRVERHELGLDGRSGRYVRIEHDDGTLTAYMHLDDIADGLEVGDRVEGGQYIGTLGATATFAAPPHCHFSLEVPNHPGERSGDHTDTHYVDPAPFLVRARIVPAADRRHARKPAM